MMNHKTITGVLSNAWLPGKGRLSGYAMRLFAETDEQLASEEARSLQAKLDEYVALLTRISRDAGQ